MQIFPMGGLEGWFIWRKDAWFGGIGGRGGSIWKIHILGIVILFFGNFFFLFIYFVAISEMNCNEK